MLMLAALKIAIDSLHVRSCAGTGLAAHTGTMGAPFWPVSDMPVNADELLETGKLAQLEQP